MGEVSSENYVTIHFKVKNGKFFSPMTRSFEVTDDSCPLKLTSKNSIRDVVIVTDVMGDGGIDTRGHV